MLVLSRQRNESIIIGDNVIITIVDIRGDKVRLGIQAPKEVSVHRQEVYDAITRQQLEANGATPEEIKRLTERFPPIRRGNKKDRS